MRPASDGTAVVGGAVQVHVLVGLRVIDASIILSIVTGNLNAPKITMAEKLSDKLRGQARLAPSAASVWIHLAWRSQQR